VRTSEASSLQRASVTYPISQAGIGTLTVFTPDADKKFVVTKITVYVKANAPETEGKFTFMSGATDISGEMHVLDDLFFQDGSGNEVVLKGRANGEAFKIDVVNDADITGYANIAQSQTG